MFPRWIITQRCMPGGRRTSKKPVLSVDVVPDTTRRPFWGGYNKDSTYTPQEEKGIFEVPDYRFFCAALTGWTWVTECRACGDMMAFRRETDKDIAIPMRQEHFKARGCAKLLTKAYKLLLKDRVCVICDTHTTKERWGIYLCSTACQQAWCESETCPASLQMALKLVEKS